MDDIQLIKLYSPHLFWDTDRDTLDFGSHKNYIIKQVLEYGYDSDWKLLKEYYGIEEIRNTAMNLRSLDKKAAYFIASITNTNIQDFRCYTLIQSKNTLWNY